MENFNKRQKQIIDAVIRIISEEGTANLSIRKIAKDVGIREGSIYNHFKSKEEILDGILSLFMEDATAIITFISALNSSNIDKIEYFYKRITENIISDLSYMKILLTADIFAGYKDLNEKYQSIMHKYRELIINTISDGQKAGEIRNDVMAEYITPLISGTFDVLIRRPRFIHNYDLRTDSDLLWSSIKKLITT